MGFLYTALCFLLAGWTFQDTRKRSQPWLASILWTLGTFSAPFLFFPLYLIFGRRLGVQQKTVDYIDVEAKVVENKVKCPMCGKETDGDLPRCTSCGHSLRPSCPHCHEEVQRDFKVCPYCQKELHLK